MISFSSVYYGALLLCKDDEQSFKLWIYTASRLCFRMHVVSQACYVWANGGANRCKQAGLRYGQVFWQACSQTLLPSSNKVVRATISNNSIAWQCLRL